MPWHSQSGEEDRERGGRRWGVGLEDALDDSSAEQIGLTQTERIIAQLSWRR